MSRRRPGEGCSGAGSKARVIRAAAEVEEDFETAPRPRPAGPGTNPRASQPSAPAQKLQSRPAPPALPWPPTPGPAAPPASPPHASARQAGRSWVSGARNAWCEEAMRGWGELPTHSRGGVIAGTLQQRPTCSSWRPWAACTTLRGLLALLRWCRSGVSPARRRVLGRHAGSCARQLQEPSNELRERLGRRVGLMVLVGDAPGPGVGGVSVGERC